MVAFRSPQIHKSSRQQHVTKRWMCTAANQKLEKETKNQKQKLLIQKKEKAKYYLFLPLLQKANGFWTQ